MILSKLSSFFQMFLYRFFLSAIVLLGLCKPMWWYYITENVAIDWPQTIWCWKGDSFLKCDKITLTIPSGLSWIGLKTIDF